MSEDINTMEEKKVNRWLTESYQPTDGRTYFATEEGVTPYNKREFQLFTLRLPKIKQKLFNDTVEGEIVGSLLRDKLDRPIKKGDYIYQTNRRDFNFPKVINKTKGGRLIIEDQLRGGRAYAFPDEVLVMTDQLEANEINRQQRNVKIELGSIQHSSCSPTTPKTRIKFLD